MENRMTRIRIRTLAALALAGALAAPLALAQAQAAKNAAPEKTAPAAAPRVLLATSAGDITIELDPDHAPKTVANFLQYVKAGHYDGTIFHRVIDGFMIQGGGMKEDMSEKKTRPPIPIESNNGLLNTRGTVAMARTSDPNSATAQFFMFGHVVAGMDVVDKIRTVATATRGPHQNVPVQPVVIRTARIVK
jgi:peptidyl-prolyl cis-trans isomerase A (cyclophilin A)